MLKRLISLSLAVITALSMVGATSTMAGAAISQAAASAGNQDSQALGLIIRYRNGVSALDSNGSVTGSSLVSTPLKNGKALGRGYHAVSFVNPTSMDEAHSIANQLAADPRILSVDIDQRVFAQSLPRLTNGIRPLAPRAKVVFSPASVVRNLKAVDGFSASAPRQAAINLTWRAPANLYLGTVIGYKIEMSNNAGLTWQTLTATTKSKATTYSVKSGLSAGTSYQFRVTAITKYKTKIKVGKVSPVVAAVPTTVPAPPVFLTTRTLNLLRNPVWVEQNAAQKGGLPVTYQVTAVANGQPNLTCTTDKNTCAFQGVQQDINYKVDVTAVNARGSTTNLNQIAVQDELFPLQWYTSADTGINAEEAWPQTRGSASVVVAVLDSGITDHPDLNAAILKNGDGSDAGYDFISDSGVANDGNGWDADPHDPGDYNPDLFDANDSTTYSSWHGTHVTGLIAAQMNNIGITGVAPLVKILPVRVLGNSRDYVLPAGQLSDLVAALNWSAGILVPGVSKTNPNLHPANVINMSMGTSGYSACPQTMIDTIAALKARNVTVITAAGNGNQNAFGSFPGNCFGTINIGATAINGDRAVYSNWGLGVDLSAPGGDEAQQSGAPATTNGQIISLLNKGQTGPTDPGYAVEEGTSMAAPLVAGVVALMYSVKPNITPDQVWQTLKATASPFKKGGICATTQVKTCGAGILNAGAAVALASSLP